MNDIYVCIADFHSYQFFLESKSFIANLPLQYY